MHPVSSPQAPSPRQARDHSSATPPGSQTRHCVSVTLSGVRGKNPQRAEQGRGELRDRPRGLQAPLPRTQVGQARPTTSGPQTSRALPGAAARPELRQDLRLPQGRTPRTLAPSGPQTGSNPETHVGKGDTATPSSMQPGPAPLTPNVDIISEATRPRGWAAGLPSPDGRSRSLRVRGGTGLHRSPRQRDPPPPEPKSSPLPAGHLVAQGTQKVSGQGCSRIGPWRTPMWGQRLTHRHFPTPRFRSQEAVNSEPQLQTGRLRGRGLRKHLRQHSKEAAGTSRCQTSLRPRKHSRIKPKSPKVRHSSKRDSPSGHEDQVPPASRPMRVKRGAKATQGGHGPHATGQQRMPAPGAERGNKGTDAEPSRAEPAAAPPQLLPAAPTLRKHPTASGDTQQQQRPK